jgi:hypothetical protein
MLRELAHMGSPYKSGHALHGQLASNNIVIREMRMPARFIHQRNTGTKLNVEY